MVEIKVDKQEIMFRVVLCGHPGASTKAAIRDLHLGLEGEGVRNLTVMHAGGDQIVGFRWPLAEEEDLFGMRVMIDVMARPGQTKATANDILIFRSADAIIYLDDDETTQEDGEANFLQLVDQLEHLTRTPDELPLLLQTEREAEGEEPSCPFGEGHPWQPETFVIGPQSFKPVDVLEAAKCRVLANYRRYESELEQRGLDGHIKIRDRVYERVPVNPDASSNLAKTDSDFRLINADYEAVAGNRFLLQACIILAIISTVAAAVAVSMAL